MIDNPFLVPGANLEQKRALDPTKTEQKLWDLQQKEESLTKVLAHLPMNDEHYSNMLSELQLVAKDRSEAEKEFLEFKLREDHDFALGEDAYGLRRERIKKKLLNALETNEKGERTTYKVWDGFYLYIDHIMRVHRGFPDAFITVDIFDGLGEYHKPIKTLSHALVKETDGTFRKTIAERHRIYGLVPNQQTYLMVKLWVQEKIAIYDPNEFDDVMKVEEEDNEPDYEEKIVPYGWVPLKLFYKEKLM